MKAADVGHLIGCGKRGEIVECQFDRPGNFTVDTKHGFRHGGTWIVRGHFTVRKSAGSTPAAPQQPGCWPWIPRSLVRQAGPRQGADAPRRACLGGGHDWQLYRALISEESSA